MRTWLKTATVASAALVVAMSACSGGESADQQINPSDAAADWGVEADARADRDAGGGGSAGTDGFAGRAGDGSVDAGVGDTIDSSAEAGTGGAAGHAATDGGKAGTGGSLAGGGGSPDSGVDAPDGSLVITYPDSESWYLRESVIVVGCWVYTLSNVGDRRAWPTTTQATIVGNAARNFGAADFVRWPDGGRARHTA